MYVKLGPQADVTNLFGLSEALAETPTLGLPVGPFSLFVAVGSLEDHPVPKREHLLFLGYWGLSEIPTDIRSPIIGTRFHQQGLGVQGFGCKAQAILV